MSRRLIRRRMPLAATFVAGLVALLVSFPAAQAASTTAVTISIANTSVGSFSTQISSNNVYAGLVDDTPAGKSNMAALDLSLVRIHAGDDGTNPPALPENTKGQWDFSSLDILVNDETSYGREPFMNIKFAPDWMWTCSSFGQPGTVVDQTFQTYADYMARLVSYYNKGSMTTESGKVITNPAGTKNRMTYWEPWNEPDLNNETPCAPPSGYGLSPAQYLTMWNAVTPKMLAVDPTLKLVGPATANGQVGSGTGADNEYIKTLMAGAQVKPSVLSFHGYGYWDNTVSDKWIFDGDGSPGPNGGIDDIVAAAQSVHDTYPTIPMWITEINVNADWGNDPRGRPWGPLGAAWWGTAYVELAPLNVSVLHQYDIAGEPQFGLLNEVTGAPYLPYWVVKGLNAAFPMQSTRLQTSSPDANILVLAARRPDGKVSVLVVNRRVDSANPNLGAGLPADVQVPLDAFSPSAVTLQQIDSTTSATAGPPTTTLPSGQNPTLHFPGYGMAILTVTPGQTGQPTVTSFTPSSGGDGQSVVITGTNFAGVTGVSFTLSNSLSYVVNSPTQITAQVPPNVYGPGKIRVTTGAGTGASSSNFTPLAPFIYGFTPGSGANGSNVVITGNNLGSVTNVSLYFANATFTIDSPTQITAQVPANVPGPGRWRVTNPKGTGTSGNLFTPTAPIVSVFSPSSGQSGSTVTISGSGFTGASEVSLYFRPATFVVNSPTQITATVPPDVPGPGKWRVTTPNGMGQSPTQYTPTSPAVTGFTPSSGPVGSTVTLTGINLTGATQVTLYFVTCSFTYNSPSSITVTIPPGVPGPGRFRVTTPTGLGTSDNQFTVS